MKKYWLIILLFAGVNSFAQNPKNIEKFYDYNWRECEPSVARYYAVIGFKDSLWFRHDYFIREKKLQMQGSYRDSACKIPQGLFYYFHANGNLESTGKYENGKREGLWLRYHSNKTMHDSVFYTAGHPSGLRQMWYSNGYPSDSSVYNENGITIHVSWFDNGNPSSAGRTINDSLHGRWQFFHKNGQLSAMEVYDHGRLVTREYYNDQGDLMSDTSNRDRSAEFPGGQQAWNEYILSKLFFPTQYQITGGDQAIVVVNAVIDEEGKLTEIEVTAPFYPAFNDIAVNALKKAPKWKPAISHNRKISQVIRQPVTFQQTD